AKSGGEAKAAPPASGKPERARGVPAGQEVRPAAAPEGKAASRGLADGRVFVGEVAVPDGGRIALEGIVYSETNPVALINGKVLPPGSVVEEFTIIAIQPDRVALNGRGVTIYLALK